MEEQKTEVALTIREILDRELQKRKTKNASYSLRAFARQLELSPSFLCEILKGKKSVTKGTFDRICSNIDGTQKAVGE